MTRSEKQTARRLPVGAILLVAFIAVPLAEIAVFIELGGLIGLGWTLGLIVLTAVVGTWMLRWQGFTVLARAQRELDQDRVPVLEVFEGLCLLLAGALLLTPGFITDTLGALLLLPPVRAVLYREVRKRVEAHIVARAAGRGGGPGPGRRPPTIDADFEEVDPESERGPEDDGPLPPPRRGWDRDR